MNKITVIMKVTQDCNMHCKHCYEFNNQLSYSPSIMSINTLNEAIKKLQNEFKYVTYIWFGGEPLIAGIDFYKKAISFQKEHNKGNIINNRIQTNGTLLSDEIIYFLKDNDFNISISFDGQYNNILRENTDLVYTRIKRCMELGLQAHIISTICSETTDKQIEIYEYIKSMNTPMKFNAIFPAGAAHNNSKYLIDEDLFCNCTIEFFHHWLNDESAIPVSAFVNYIKMYLKNGGRNCVYNACLYSVIDIEPNGDMFPCSRYYKQDHIIGNISKIKKIAAAFESDNFKKIVIDSIKRRNKCKNDCELYEYCLGGCTSACANETNIADNNTQLCRITQKILHAVFNEIEQAIKENNYVNPVFRYLLQ